MSLPRKTPVTAIDPGRLGEPALSENDLRDYRQGWDLFNRGEYWHAHEAWERVWIRCPDEGRIFFQGIIQFAAALHLMLQQGRYSGMMRNFSKAEEKLQLFPDHFLHTDVRGLERQLSRARDLAQHLGPDRHHMVDRSLLPVIPLRF
jgi:predicted metal-dependent hydrolase